MLTRLFTQWLYETDWCKKHYQYLNFGISLKHKPCLSISNMEVDLANELFEENQWAYFAITRVYNETLGILEFSKSNRFIQFLAYWRLAIIFHKLWIQNSDVQLNVLLLYICT